METLPIAVDELTVGDVIFAEHEDALNGRIRGTVVAVGTDEAGVRVVWVQRTGTSVLDIEKLREGLFGEIQLVIG